MGTVNLWLLDRLEVRQPSRLDLILEVEPQAAPEVRLSLSSVIGLTQDLIMGRFIPLRAAPAQLGLLADIPGVRTVSYNAPIGIPAMGISDPLLGTRPFSLEVSRAPTVPALPLGLSMGIQASRMIVIPTSESRQVLMPPGNSTLQMVVGVVDTGMTPGFPGLPPSIPTRLMSFTGEPPMDGMGHGMWCSACAFGAARSTPWGRIQGVATVEAPGLLLHAKALSNIGFGSTVGILKAMEWCVDQGAVVVSMSLGGELQGSVDEDPLCRAIEINPQTLFVVAAGNSGPEAWTIGSPAASPFAITVGAYGLTDQQVSWFSSRGPSGAFYRDNPQIWQQDLAKYGERLMKPDILAPGGGRALQETQPDEQLLSSVSGWYDLADDLIPNGLGKMKGSSMATPHAAGLLALALERGIIRGRDDVRARFGQKDQASGWGLITWPRLASEAVAGGASTSRQQTQTVRI